eukprot:9104760-Pyramimonas_sp.AAC.1
MNLPGAILGALTTRETASPGPGGGRRGRGKPLPEGEERESKASGDGVHDQHVRRGLGSAPGGRLPRGSRDRAAAAAIRTGCAPDCPFGPPER